MDAALFDATPYVIEATTPPKLLSPDARRTLRQRQAVTNGVHPLTLALGYPIAVHPDAPRGRTGDGPRCGSCWYRRRINTGSARDWPKCLYGLENDTDQHRAGPPPRASRGAGTDVRAWWPACRDYSPGDTSLSPDAARYIPAGAS